MLNEARLVTRRVAGITALVALGALGATSPATAQDRYPSQPIKVIVPYPPGGSTDVMARQVADHLSRELGQPVLIENRPGASTNIGADVVAKATPNGYTLLFGSEGLVQSDLRTDAELQYDALARTDEPGRASAVHRCREQDAPFSTPKELIAAAKAAPGKFSVSSAQLELYVDLLKSRAGINLLHVPYKGGAAATTDAISGQVDMVYALVPVILPHVQGGSLKALGVTSAKRISVLPAVPTFAESGVDYDETIWYGLLAPTGTPKSIVNRLSIAPQKIMSQPGYRADRLSSNGATAISSRPEEFRAQLEARSRSGSKSPRACRVSSSPNLKE